MRINSTLKKYLLNQTISKEYLCVSKEKYTEYLNVFTTSGNKIFDVTENHSMLGYKPLVISITSEARQSKGKSQIPGLETLSFRTKDDFEIANLELVKIDDCRLNCDKYTLYLCKKGKHKFSTSIAKIFQYLNYNLTAKSAANVFLKGNLFSQVKIAYAVPRIVSLMCIHEFDLLNIFPTDLNGMAGEIDYLVSFRSGGKANMQLKQYRKVVLCMMESSRCSEAYKLGKNHMKDLSSIKNFSLESIRSEVFNSPLPLGTLKYYELEWVNSFEIGIHEIHLLKILNSKTLKENKHTLAHIHRDILEWRLRRNIPTEYILR